MQNNCDLICQLGADLHAVICNAASVLQRQSEGLIFFFLSVGARKISESSGGCSLN
jgi:hypothetical protein